MAEKTSANLATSSAVRRPSGDPVEFLDRLSKQQGFATNFAWHVVQQDSECIETNDVPFGPVMLAEAVAQAHSIELRSGQVTVNTRPDILFTHKVEFSPLIRASKAAAVGRGHPSGGPGDERPHWVLVTREWAGWGINEPTELLYFANMGWMLSMFSGHAVRRARDSAQKHPELDQGRCKWHPLAGKGQKRRDQGRPSEACLAGRKKKHHLPSVPGLKCGHVYRKWYVHDGFCTNMRAGVLGEKLKIFLHRMSGDYRYGMNRHIDGKPLPEHLKMAHPHMPITGSADVTLNVVEIRGRPECAFCSNTSFVADAQGRWRDWQRRTPTKVLFRDNDFAWVNRLDSEGLQYVNVTNVKEYRGLKKLGRAKK